MGRWWRSLDQGGKIAVIGLVIALFGALPAWLALQTTGQGGVPETTEAAPTSLATETTASNATDATDTMSDTSAASPVAAGTVTKYLSWDSNTSDPQELPYFAGFASDQGPQEINGSQYPRNVTFAFECSTTLDKYADYNLGRHYERFQAVIGPGDTSSQSYRFEIWRDGQPAYSGTLRHGQSKKIDMSVKNVLTLRLSACAVVPEEGGNRGGVYGDPRVIGKASEVPPPTTG
jgi:hypothetical protein